MLFLILLFGIISLCTLFSYIIKYISMKNDKIVCYSLLDGEVIKKYIQKTFFVILVSSGIIFVLGLSLIVNMSFKEKSLEYSYLTYEETKVEREELLQNIDERVENVSDFERKVIWNLLDTNWVFDLTMPELYEIRDYPNSKEKFEKVYLKLALYHVDIEKVYQVMSYLNK